MCWRVTVHSVFYCVNREGGCRETSGRLANDTDGVRAGRRCGERTTELQRRLTLVVAPTLPVRSSGPHEETMPSRASVQRRRAR
ncbi:hypothetical protein F2P81_023743 [Scophthalmus maximus]|uniref:Uncharacterized protein n=1 Tax=Scophthalmus maximus TaxID=52904 RepID=A0A6A4RMM5_SCOMX|nr:hypothetical protein F2P81_023743 [Scophthalmus maximus]